jgi:peptidoglycan biosynthesis protein MviN/MurJ (putative lipid II flippase)
MHLTFSKVILMTLTNHKAANKRVRFSQRMSEATTLGTALTFNAATQNYAASNKWS